MEANISSSAEATACELETATATTQPSGSAKVAYEPEAVPTPAPAPTPQSDWQKMLGDVVPVHNDGGGNCFYLSCARHPEVFPKQNAALLLNKDAGMLSALRGLLHRTALSLQGDITRKVGTESHETLASLFLSHSSGNNVPGGGNTWSLFPPEIEGLVTTWAAAGGRSVGKEFNTLRSEYIQASARSTTYVDNLHIVLAAKMLSKSINILSWAGSPLKLHVLTVGLAIRAQHRCLTLPRQAARREWPIQSCFSNTKHRMALITTC